jgi:ferric-dicitrate binding protein FerR (iron transport regulator)
VSEATGNLPRDQDDVVARLVGMAGPRPPAPNDVTNRVRAVVRSDWQAAVRARRMRARVFLVALPAAAGLVLAVAGSIWFRPGQPPDALGPLTALRAVARPELAAGATFTTSGLASGRLLPLVVGAEVPAGATVLTDRAGRAALRTTDGVSLRVGAATRLRLVSPTEWLLEEGVIYVDNPPSNRQQVRVAVHTSTATVRDVGTQFEVSARSSSLRVRVREGTALVGWASRTETASAGTELRVGPGDRVERHAIPVHGPEWSWVVDLATPIDIEGRRLGDYLAWVTREMGWRLEYRSNELARSAPGIVLHGSVSGLTTDEALATVLATCGLEMRVDHGTLLVDERRPEARRP